MRKLIFIIILLLNGVRLFGQKSITSYSEAIETLSFIFKYSDNYYIKDDDGYETYHINNIDDNGFEYFYLSKMDDNTQSFSGKILWKDLCSAAIVWNPDFTDKKSISFQLAQYYKNSTSDYTIKEVFIYYSPSHSDVDQVNSIIIEVGNYLGKYNGCSN